MAACGRTEQRESVVMRPVTPVRNGGGAAQRRTALLTHLGAVWGQPGRYPWLVSYLSSRGLETPVRWMLAVATAAYGVLPVTMLWSPSGAHGNVARVMVVIVAGVLVLSAVRWAWGWPPPWQAIGYVVIADAAIAVICVSYANPLVGLVGCLIFATLGGHIAFFHSLRLQVLNVVLGLVVATFLGLRTLHVTGDVVVALNVYVVVTVAIAGISMNTHLIVHVLGVDLNVADTDPLGGLLNRRAFYRVVGELLTKRGRPGGRVLCVSLIDLDRFKRLNDSRGHRVGDLALITVSRLLDDLTAVDAVVARIGGEEFVIAEFTSRTEAQQQGHSLCAAIAATGFGVTASIGVASTVPPTLVANSHAFIDDLVHRADTAMYEAKRAGGNQTWLAPETPHPHQ